jgi:hypothetical protein
MRYHTLKILSEVSDGFELTGVVSSVVSVHGWCYILLMFGASDDDIIQCFELLVVGQLMAMLCHAGCGPWFGHVLGVKTSDVSPLPR